MDFVSSNGKAFAYQGAIGLKFNVHENFLIFTDARHIATVNSEFEESMGLVKGKVKYFSANIGVSYLFLK